MLEEIANIFLDELAKELAPVNGTKHAIDFQPRATLPNYPAYCINPKEVKEMKKQIDELAEKGHVGESTNPCIVLAFLVPKKDETWRICINNSHKQNYYII